MTTLDPIVREHGLAVFDNPIRYNGTISAAQGRALGLDGLLPAVVETLDQQDVLH